MSESTIEIRFVGGDSVLLPYNSTILYKLKTEAWVESGEHHIKTANITHVSVHEGLSKQAEDFLRGEGPASW